MEGDPLLIEKLNTIIEQNPRSGTAINADYLR